MAGSFAYNIIIGAKDRTGRTFKKINDRASRLARSAAQVTAASVAAGSALAVFAARQIEAVDGMAKAAKAAGLSAEALQELQFAGKRVGVATRQVEEGLRRMNRRVGLAADGTGPAVAAFEKMGIALRDATGAVRSNADILDEFIRKGGELESQAEQAAAASLIFGDDAGPKLALLLQEGADGVAELREEARQLGIVTNEQAAAAERAQDAIINLKQVSGNLGKTLATELGPEIEAVANFLADGLPVAVAASSLALLKLRQIFVTIAGAINKAAEGILGILSALPSELTRLNQQQKDVLFDLAQGIGETADNLLDLADVYGEELAEGIEGFNKSLDDSDEKLQMVTVTAKRLTLEGLRPMNDEFERSIDDLPTVSALLDELTDGVDGLGAHVIRADGVLAEMVDNFESDTAKLIEDFVELGDAVGKHATNEFEAFGDVAAAVLSQIGGESGRLAQKLASVIGTIQQLGEATSRSSAAIGGAQLGGQIGGIVGSGAEEGGAIGGAAGGAIGFAIGGPVGAQIGSVIGSAIGAFIDGADQAMSELVFDSFPERASSDRFAQTDLGGVFVRSGVDGFHRVQAQITRIVNQTFDAIASLLTPEELANVDLSGLGRISITPENIDRVLADIFDRAIVPVLDERVQALIAPFEGLENKLDALQAAKAMFDAIDANPIEAFAEALEDSQRTMPEVIRDLGDAALEAAGRFDGSIRSMREMASVVGDLNQAVSQALSQIEQASQNITGITGGTIESLQFRLLGLEDPSGGAQFEFLTTRAEQLANEIDTLSDPAAIEARVAQINQLIAQAFGLVDDPAKARELFEQFAPFLRDVDDEAQRQLDAIRDEIRSAYDQAIADVRDIIGTAAASIQNGGQTIVDAGSRFNDGTVRFQKSVVTFSQGASAIAEAVGAIPVGGEVNAAA